MAAATAPPADTAKLLAHVIAGLEAEPVSAPLTCRESEWSALLAAVQPAMHGKPRAAGVFVCGSPGTGKTASLVSAGAPMAALFCRARARHRAR